MTKPKTEEEIFVVTYRWGKGSGGRVDIPATSEANAREKFKKESPHEIVSVLPLHGSIARNGF